MTSARGRLAHRLAVFAAIVFAAGLVPCSAAAVEPATSTPIKHVISLLQENHTFDNYFGTFPGVDGIPPGVCMPVDLDRSGGECIKPFRMGGSAALDLDHSRAAFEIQYHGGKMDGFVAAQRGAESTMGYYDAEDLPYYWNLAEEFVLFDRFFSSSSGGSTVNHVYWIAGAPGPKPDSIPPNGLDVPTIFDSLEAAGVSWKFYIQNYDPSITFRNLKGQGDRASQVIWAPLLSIPRFIDDPKLSAHIVDLDEYYDDLVNGTLPAVSYLVPSGASEHPPGSLVSGQRFVQTLINALTRSSAWNDSAFLLAYDDWGGWYDHVAPPQVDDFGYGFRVPALLVSPYARRGYIDHTELDFTSVLRFVEDNWRLRPLGDRDGRAKTFAGAMDFSQSARLPAFVGWERGPAATGAEPNRPVLYAAYSAAIGLAVLLMITAVVVERRRASPGR